MKILILGGDVYLGWPTAMHLSAAGHDVAVVDNYLRRRMCAEQTWICSLYQICIVGPVMEREDWARDTSVRWGFERLGFCRRDFSVVYAGSDRSLR